MLYPPKRIRHPRFHRTVGIPMSERAGSYILPPLQNIRPRMFKQKHKQTIKTSNLRLNATSFCCATLILLSSFFTDLTLLFCFLFYSYSSLLYSYSLQVPSRKEREKWLWVPSTTSEPNSTSLIDGQPDTSLKPLNTRSIYGTRAGS